MLEDLVTMSVDNLRAIKKDISIVVQYCYDMVCSFISLFYGVFPTLCSISMEFKLFNCSNLCTVWYTIWPVLYVFLLELIELSDNWHGCMKSSMFVTSFVWPFRPGSHYFSVKYKPVCVSPISGLPFMLNYLVCWYWMPLKTVFWLKELLVWQ